MSKILSEAVYEELKEWLGTQQISSTSWRGDFADAVLAAKVVSSIDSKLIVMQHYVPCVSFKQKRSNWEMLNVRALCELNLVQPPSVLDQLAKGTQGFIDMLLWDLMKYDKAPHVVARKSEKGKTDNEEIFVVAIDKTSPPQEMVLHSLYEVTKRDDEVKEAVMTAQAERIEGLEQQAKRDAAQISDLIKKMVEAHSQFAALQKRSKKDIEEVSLVSASKDQKQ